VVPIKHTIVLQGGIFENELEEQSFVAALNGETLSKAPQSVPGGLLGILTPGFLPTFLKERFEQFVHNGITDVAATNELARPASSIGINTSNLVNGERVGLSLPTRVHLENQFLGSECYIGSSAYPIILNLTTGETSPLAPNKPISGKLGYLEFLDEFKLIKVTNNTLVDNSFSVPKAIGCGGVFSPLVDPVIDTKLKLPSTAGHNTLIQNSALNEATSENVIASEK
jgi:hypothetical protein